MWILGQHIWLKYCLFIIFFKSNCSDLIFTDILSLLHIFLATDKAVIMQWKKLFSSILKEIRALFFYNPSCQNSFQLKNIFIFMISITLVGR